MVDSIKPTYYSVPIANPGQKGVEAPQVTIGTGNERHSPREHRYVDRRKQQDRRRNKGDRPIYDMRSRRGRRKSDLPHPTIETKV